MLVVNGRFDGGCRVVLVWWCRCVASVLLYGDCGDGLGGW